MGAWETGNFGNDDALDFVADVEEKGKGEILKAIQKIALSQDKELDATDCTIALAAIEYIAAAKGYAAEDMSEEAEEWLEKNKLLPFKTGGFLGIGAKTIDIVSLSNKAIDKIRTYSELKELWEESGDDYEEWLQVLDNLKERIST